MVPSGRISVRMLQLLLSIRGMNTDSLGCAGRQVSAEVIGTGSDGTKPSLLLSVLRHGVYSADVTVLQRYLFNCGEGTQRLCGESGIKLKSLDSVFFTRFDTQVGWRFVS